ncbi:MAG: tetratricopeptide repeat protein [Myxococcales bacterium]|nr:tetratricopeptide repeat protein [Myxococcales bacterium]
MPILLLLLVLLSCSTARADELSTPTTAAAATHTELGKSFFAQGRYDLARLEFEGAYALSKEVDLLYNLALCWEREGRPREAAEAYERYLREKPDDRETAQKLARLKEQVQPVPHERLRPRQKLGVALLVLGGATLVSALALGLVTDRDRQQLVSGNLTYREAQALADRATTERSATIALGVIGGALAVGGLVPTVW